MLSLALFCGGHNYFASQFPQRLGWQPYSIHTTFQYGAADGKRHRLREAMAWEDPPEYYDPPGGLLSYTPHVPRQLLSPAGGMRADGHVRLIEHQLAQIATALGLAAALGRTLVLPPVTCGYDKAWYALDRSGAFSGAPRLGPGLGLGLGLTLAPTRTLTLTLTLALALTLTQVDRADPQLPPRPLRRAARAHAPP